MAGARSRRHAAEGHAQLETISRNDLTAKTSPVDATKEWESSGVPGIGQHGNGTELCERLDHEDAGQRRAARKVPFEERFFSRQIPPARRRHAGFDGGDLGQEEKWSPVWEHILDSKDSSHPRDNTEAAGSRAGFQVLGAAFSVALGDFRGREAFSGLGDWAPAFSALTVLETAFRSGALRAAVFAASP
jgi:hypothetical protein